MRKSSEVEVIANIRLYSSLLEAFIAMATTKGADHRLAWLEDVCALFDSMEAGTEVAAPNATTYALMLAVWLR